MARDFAQRSLAPAAAEIDRTQVFPQQLVDTMAEMGFLGMKIPEAYGGAGMDTRAYALTMEEVARKCAVASVYVSSSNSLGIAPLLLAGSEEQKHKYLPGVAAGQRFIAFALTEPDAGSDAGACRTTAVKSADGSEYVLNGTKCFITNACYADFMCVVASVDRSLGYKGLTMFLVDAHLPGVSIGKHEDKMGIRQSATCDVIFEDVHIPASAIIGKEGEGFKIAMKTLEQGRAGVGSGCVGIMRAILEEAAKYAQVRVTMGKPIYKQQAISAKLADMQIAIETSRAIGMKVAALLDAGDPGAAALGPIAKCYCSDALNRVATEGVQILGGYGYMRDYPMEKYMRDAKIFQIFEGTNEIQRVVIGGDVIRKYKVNK